MSDSRFALDTNILVYAADSTAGAKHHRAFEILNRARKCDSIVTLQSLAEFYAAVTRKRIVESHIAVEQVHDWMTVFAVAAADPDALRGALQLSSAGHCSFWDGLVVATAARAGCHFLLSEDMHDGMTLCGVTIRNPFAGPELPDDIREMTGLGD